MQEFQVSITLAGSRVSCALVLHHKMGKEEVQQKFAQSTTEIINERPNKEVNELPYIPICPYGNNTIFLNHFFFRYGPI